MGSAAARGGSHRSPPPDPPRGASAGVSVNRSVVGAGERKQGRIVTGTSKGTSPLPLRRCARPTAFSHIEQPLISAGCLICRTPDFFFCTNSNNIKGKMEKNKKEKKNMFTANCVTQRRPSHRINILFRYAYFWRNPNHARQQDLVSAWGKKEKTLGVSRLHVVRSGLRGEFSPPRRLA